MTDKAYEARGARLGPLLVLTPDFPPKPGGIQVVVHRLVSHLRSFSALVVTFDSTGAYAFDRSGDLAVRRVRARHLPRPLRLGLLNLVGVRCAFALRPAVVLAAHVVMAPAARAYHALTGTPYVQYLHADEICARPGLTRMSLAQAAAGIAVSEHTIQLARAAGADAARVHLIPPGVDLPHTEGAKRETTPTVLTVARLEDRYKGHDVLLRALPRIIERVPTARWVVIGDGRLRSELEAQAAALKIDGHVHFLGSISDGERDLWLDRAHVFAMPSRLPPGSGGEGFGIVYLEANAHGLPVVAGDVAGAREAILNDETGVLVDPEDAGAVADAIAELLVDRRRAEALGQAGCRRAHQFSWPRIATQIEAVLADAAGGEA